MRLMKARGLSAFHIGPVPFDAATVASIASVGPVAARAPLLSVATFVGVCGAAVATASSGTFVAAVSALGKVVHVFGSAYTPLNPGIAALKVTDSRGSDGA